MSERERGRGRWFRLNDVPEEYGSIFTPRLLRRLTQEHRLPFSRAGRCIVVAEADLLAYLEANREEPPRLRTIRGRGVAS